MAELPLPRVITLTGGGGKTSLMYYLARVLKSLNIPTVTTSTTKLANQETPGVVLMKISNLDEGYRAVEQAQLSQQQITLVRGKDKNNPHKLRGIPATWIDQLATSFPAVAFLVEGDGSAGRSLKGHLAHEPVIPTTSNLVIPVVGIDALGARLNGVAVHRPQRVSELIAVPADAMVDEEMVVKLLFYPGGYLRKCLPGQKVIPFINKVETDTQRCRARNLAHRILAFAKRQQVQSVVVGSIKEGWADRIDGGVTAVILAAGRSSRMGQPKQLLALGGKPMVWQVAHQACQAQLREVLVVTGSYDREIRHALAGLPLKTIHNKNWAQGQATSIKKAVQSLTNPTQAVLFLLADQPLINTKLINDIINAYQGGRTSIVAPHYRGRRGNPVLFDLGRWRDDLLNLTGDQGARSIIIDNPRAVNYLTLNSGHYFLDVDTPEDYAKMQTIWRHFN